MKEFLWNRWDWIYNSTKDYLYDITIGEMKKEMRTELLSYVSDLKYIFTIIAIIGLYCTMAGEKKTGNKITSFSIFIYLIARVVFATYGF